MKRTLLKRAAAIGIAVCVGFTFIPLAGGYDAFAADENPAADTALTPQDAEGAGSETASEGSEVTVEKEEPINVTETNDGDGGEDGEGGDPVTIELRTEDDGYTYCYVNGERQTGFQTIDGDLYYFDPETGAMVTGVVKIHNNDTDADELYYFFDSGKAVSLTNQWFKGDDAASANRYALGEGRIAAGRQAILVKKTSTLYWFDTETGIAQPKGFFIGYHGRTYYSKGNGLLAVGWQAIKRDGKLNGYYFYKKYGYMAKDTTIHYLKIPKSGKLHEAYARGILKLNKTKWTLKQAYINSYKIKYQGRWWRQKTSEKYAMKGFKYNKGNCYVMAATFYIQAKLLGYNVRQIHGKVAYRAPHSWTQIKIKGKWWVFDPNFRNETGRSGWKIYYGKKGTWRYTNYSVFQK